MKAPLIASILFLLVAFKTVLGADNPSKPQPFSGPNRLTYLDSTDPFYVGTGFPKLTTPQWIGEPGVDAAIILSIDDMTETGRYETFLRPLLERLKQIDGRAPVSIMTRSVPIEDAQVQTWLKEGLSLEVHTLNHPCPLLANGDFNAAVTNVYGCIDLLSRVPGNKPVAFRMPCCDSMDSTSPRFFAEIFNGITPAGHFLTIDSSVINIFNGADPDLPAGLISSPEGDGRFAKYFPEKRNATTRVSLGAFATTIENYPYPYVIGKLCWEFPCVAPSDWEAFNCHGATNAATVADWEAALDVTVLKQGVFTLIFHPHGWIRTDQLVSLVDYAVSKYGKRVKFLTFREAEARLDKNLLAGEPLRAANGQDNGVRLLDVNNDGWLDVVIGNNRVRTTRIWNPISHQWTQTGFPTPLLSGSGSDAGVRFGTFNSGVEVAAFFRNEAAHGAWVFQGGEWQEQPEFFAGLNLKGRPILTSEGARDRGVRLRDVNNDGSCELLVGNESQSGVFGWSEGERSWKKLGFALPPGTTIVDANGLDNGLRFVDVNGDGYDDVLFSNEKEFSLHTFIAQAKPWLGWEVGWSYQVRAGKRGDPGEIPMVARGAPHPDNGAWFHGQQMYVQNEETTALAEKVRRASFNDLQLGGEAPPKSPSEALSTFRVAPGLKIELVVSEPQVLDPVAFDWTQDGRLWVVEMRDYPLGMDGKGKPGGVVRVLEDTKGDGHYDKSTIFLEGLRFPNGLLPWRKGLLVSAAPDVLYAEDTSGNGKADVQRLLFTGFREGNQQHRVNGFEYGLDNWVYAANGGSGGTVHSVSKNFELNLRGHDLRFNPDDGSMELQPGPTQFGRHRDDWGNWFGNDNSRWLWHYFLPEQYLARNPHLAVTSLMKQLPADADAERIFAVSRPQQRFNWPTHLYEVTSACSATPYRDEVLGSEFASSVFICEPANNVIHREVLQPEGISFVSHRGRWEAHSEFLASTDNWFRPVMVKTGPDGALYIADMYRLIIEHPEYFPEELKHRPDLRAGEDKGRIYRVYPANAQLRKIPRLDRLSLPELVAAMNSPNGWQRDTVQRLLVEAQNPVVVKDLENLVLHNGNPKIRLQALATLDGLHGLTPKTLLAALGDAHYAVRRRAIALSEPRFGELPELGTRLLEMKEDPDVRVRYQLAFSLGEWKGTPVGKALAQLALEDWPDQAMQTAILSSAPRHLEILVMTVLSQAASGKAEFNEVQTTSQSGSRGTRPSEMPSEGLVENLVALATEMPENRVLAYALDQLATSSKDFAPWQFAGVAGFLDGLDKRKLSLSAFKSQAGAEFQQSLSRLEAMFVQARKAVLDPAVTEQERLITLRLLGRSSAGQEQDIAALGRLIEPENPAPIQEAALVQFGRVDNPGVPQAVLKSWKASNPSRKQQILNLLFSRPGWTEAVLAAVEQDQLTAAELGALQRQKLLNYSEPEIRARAAKLLSGISVDRQQVVAKYKAVPELTGDRSRGHALFTQNCSICHSSHGEGHHVGPDLGTMAEKPAPEIVVAILDPNQAVDPAYAAYTVVTKDDRELTGVLIADTPNSISLRMAGGSEETVLRSSIKELSSSGRSLMPEGFETGLKPQDVADLIAFICDTAASSSP